MWPFYIDSWKVREGTPIGLEAKKYMESGQLVPDKVIIDMVVAEIKSKSKGPCAAVCHSSTVLS
jgi:adenylate kinase family enzyme